MKLLQFGSGFPVPHHTDCNNSALLGEVFPSKSVAILLYHALLCFAPTPEKGYFSPLFHSDKGLTQTLFKRLIGEGGE